MKLILLVLLWPEIMAIASVPDLQIVLLHDGSVDQFDPAREWPEKLNMVFTDLAFRFPALKFSASPSLLSIKTPQTGRQRNLMGVIILARCARGNTLEAVARKLYPQVPILRSNTEYCHDPQALLLTWLEVDWPCFMHGFQSWVQNLIVQLQSSTSRIYSPVNPNLQCPFRHKMATHIMDAYQFRYRRNILNGRTIRMGAMNSSTISLISGDFNHPKSLKTSGIFFDHMDILAETLNFTYELVIHDPERIGMKTSNGSWTGLLSLSANDAFDLSSYAISYEHGRYEAADWIFSAYDNAFAFVIPVPQVDKSWLASTLPYTYEVWLYIVGFLLVFGLLSGFHDFIQAYLNGNRFGSIPSSCLWYIFDYFRVLFNQGGHDAISQHASRTLMGFWCLLALVVINLYTSVLTGYLTLPQVHPVIRSLRDLAQSSHHRMVFINEHILTTLFLNPRATDDFAIIGQRARKHPEDFVDNRTAAIEKVAQGTYVLTEALPTTYAAIATDYKTHGRCRVSLLRSDFLTVQATFFTPKGNPYWHFFYTKLGSMVEVGIFQKTNKKLLQMSPCLGQKSKVIAPALSLTLSDLTSPFALYAIGLALAIAAFFAELIYPRFTLIF